MSGKAVPVARRFASVEAWVEQRQDGTALFHSGRDLPPQLRSMGDWLGHWAEQAPERTFLADRRGHEWRRLTYGEAWVRAGKLAGALRRIGCGPESPLLVLAGNTLEHALLTLAGFLAGVPVAPVSTAYVGFGSDERLRLLTDLSGARAAYLGPEIPDRLRATMTGWGLALIDIDEALAHGDAVVACRPADLDAAAKLMFTSGSTGVPKSVIVTHRMMAANQEQLRMIWPSVADRPPVLVDWLPWNHTFGGNFVFNMALRNGGTLYVDDGKPSPALVGRTLSALAEIGPTRYFSVPVGFEALLPALEASPDLARRAFRNLEFAFCAAAALPQLAHDRLSRLLAEATGRDVPLIGGWGSTETAPCATAVHFPTSDARNIGVPLPGAVIKLVPAEGKFELRIKGPNVTPGYWRNPEATEAAFDEEGFYRIGDAGKLIDPAHPQAGLAFDGRVAENFKLTTGTWVTVGALRLAIIDAARPHVRDAVIAGHGRDEIGALLFLNEESCAQAFDLAEGELPHKSAQVLQWIDEALRRYNAQSGGGSSSRIARFRVEACQPSPDAGEITDKGYINQRAVLENRAYAVEALFAGEAFRTGH